MNPRPLLPAALLLSALLLALPARADEESDLIGVLQSTAAAPKKCEACQRLRLVGTARAVPALAALLGDERVSQAARFALEGLPLAEAGEALRAALATTTGPARAGVIDSLGWRRDTAAVPLLAPLLAGPDPVLAPAAAAALGRIGTADAAAALKASQSQASPATLPVLLESLIQCAEQALARGDAPAAVALVKDLDGPGSPDSIRAAAWRCLVLAEPASRAERIPQALASGDPALITVARRVLRDVPDAAVLAACLGAWDTLPEPAQLAVLDAGVRDASTGPDVIRRGATSAHAAVRLASWQAMGAAGGSAFVPLLVRAAAEGDAAGRAAARDALSQLRGAGVDDALLEQLGAAPEAGKIEVLRALGERNATATAPVLLQRATNGPEAVRLAALDALRRLAVPATLEPLLDLAATATGEDVRDGALGAVFALGEAAPDKDAVSRQVVTVLGRLPVAARRPLLPVLGELGTRAALDALLTASKDGDGELMKESLRVLGQWSGTAPGPRLLEVARAATDPSVQALALRGYVAVTAHEPDPATRLALLQEGLAAARRPEEKRQALGQIGQIPTSQALALVLPALDDPALVNEAGLAALAIAEKLVATQPAVGPEVAARVLAVSKGPDLVRRAWALRGKAAAPGPFIQDWLVAGPYRHPGANDALAIFNVPLGPEKAGEAVAWKPAPRGDMINLSGLFSDTGGSAAYLKTRLVVPAPVEALLLMGSDDGLKAWLNGEVVHANNIDRGAVADQDLAPIRLKAGANDLLLKVTQGGGGWAACARLVGLDGRPLAGLKVEPVP